MSLDAQKLVDIIKEAAKMAVNEGAPFSFCIGKVIQPPTNGKGLKIMVDQKLILGDKHLLLTNNVRDYEVKLTTKGDDKEQTGSDVPFVDADAHFTETAVTAPKAPEDYSAFLVHNHAYSGDKWFKVNLALKINESVLLLRIDGGQKYIVLDRVEPPKKEVV